MAISNQSTRYVVTLGIGATTTTFAFDYLLITNIKVYFNGILQIYGSTYTILNKVVTFTSPLQVITVVSVISNQPYGAIFDFKTPEEWVASTINELKDTFAIQIQQVRDQAVLVGSADPSTDVVTLLNTAVKQASASATASDNSATASALSSVTSENWATSNTIVQNIDYSAKQWATKTGDTVDGVNYSAKQWALTTSVLTIPLNSITANKMSLTDTFTFNDMNIGNIRSSGNILLSNGNTLLQNGYSQLSKYGQTVTMPKDANIVFSCNKASVDKTVELLNDGSAGIRVINNAGTQSSGIILNPSVRPRMGWTGVSDSNIMSQNDTTYLTNSGMTALISLNMNGTYNVVITGHYPTPAGATYNFSLPLSAWGLGTVVGTGTADYVGPVTIDGQATGFTGACIARGTNILIGGSMTGSSGPIDAVFAITFVSTKL